MNERLLQYIWQYQYFNHAGLATVAGEELGILQAGLHNADQGPDFTGARIRIGPATWAGTVELHIRSSDWNKHAHQRDPHYSNVILHVVWEHDMPVNDIPVLELKDRVAKILLRRYEELMGSAAFIPCEKNIQTVRDITWQSWKERLLAERLLRKSSQVASCLQQNNNHWEETFWWLIARNFGMKVNADAFEQVARSVPLSLLARKKYQIHQLEALLLGQAGLLEGKFEEEYPRLLQREYKFQQKKEQLPPVHTTPLFLRMRPVNFPGVRLAQLAMLIHESVHLFSRIKEAASLKEVKEWLSVTANDYWHYHYRFDEEAPFQKKTLGAQMIDNIVINTVVPVLFAYGHYQGEQGYRTRALQWLEETGAEQNAITRGFRLMGIACHSAYDSQALIELKNEYCLHKKCLDCGAGHFILRQPVETGG